MTEGTAREITLIADGARMLAEARDLMEVRHVRDLAIAATAYARARDLGEDAVRSAQRIVILATRRLGEELLAGQDRGEVARQGQSEPFQSHVEADDMSKPATLADLGISRDLSATAKVLATAPDAVDRYLAEAAQPSIAGAIRAVNESIGQSVADMPDVQAADDLVRWARLMAGSARLLNEGDPEWWGDRLPAEDRQSLRGHIAVMRRWCDTWEQVLGNDARLRVVGGDR